MDRQEKRKNEGTTENGNASDGTPDNSDHEDKVSIKKFKILAIFWLAKIWENNCAIPCAFPQLSRNGRVLFEEFKEQVVHQLDPYQIFMLIIYR